jgi:hypothetical protein
VTTTRANGLLADITGRFQVWEADPGQGTPAVWEEREDLAWGYFGAQEVALEADCVARLFEDPERARELSGVFALLAVDRSRHRVLAINDKLGVQAVYYNQGRAATHLMWLLQDSGHDGTVEPEGFWAHMVFGYTARPVYRGVEKLGQASHVVLEGDAARSRVYWTAPELQTNAEAGLEPLAEALRQAAPRHGLLGATAGKDSLVLAAALAQNPPCWTGTFGVAGCADQAQGEELSRRLGTPHLTRGVCRNGEDFGRWASHVAFHSAGLATASYADMAAFVGETVPPGATFVMGEGGECVRDFFRPGLLRERYMTALEHLQETLAMETELPPAAQDGLKFYRTERMPGNFSLRHAVLAVLRPRASPFLANGFVEPAFALDRRWHEGARLHRALLEQLRPQWLDLFDAPACAGISTQDWERRFAGEIGEQVGRMLEEDLRACADVFRAEGVRSLCERTIRRPGRAMYHLFRLLSFARARQMLRP